MTPICKACGQHMYVGLGITIPVCDNRGCGKYVMSDSERRSGRKFSVVDRPMISAHPSRNVGTASFLAIGRSEDEPCNRIVDGAVCSGVVAFRDVEGCTCHTGHPPCGACTTDTSYCPECEWRAKDED